VFIAVSITFDTDIFSYDLVEFLFALNTILHRCAIARSVTAGA
jgi:hypothetical protein